MLSCDVIIWEDNIPLFYFSWKLHSLILMFRTCTIAHSLRSLGPLILIFLRMHVPSILVPLSLMFLDARFRQNCSSFSWSPHEHSRHTWTSSCSLHVNSEQTCSSSHVPCTHVPCAHLFEVKPWLRDSFPIRRRCEALRTEICEEAHTFLLSSLLAPSHSPASPQLYQQPFLPRS